MGQKTCTVAAARWAKLAGKNPEVLSWEARPLARTGGRAGGAGTHQVDPKPARQVTLDDPGLVAHPARALEGLADDVGEGGTERGPDETGLLCAGSHGCVDALGREATG